MKSLMLASMLASMLALGAMALSAPSYAGHMLNSPTTGTYHGTGIAGAVGAAVGDKTVSISGDNVIADGNVNLNNYGSNVNSTVIATGGGVSEAAGKGLSASGVFAGANVAGGAKLVLPSGGHGR